MAHPQIAVFARLAKENSKPNRVIAGQATRLSRTMHDIRHDPVNDEVWVTNPFAKAVLTFRGSVNGEEAPIRVIQGPSTQLGPNTDHVDVDAVHNEIFVPTRGRIMVFPRTAQGDVAPIRVIQGPDTRLTTAFSLAVDPINNVLVVGLVQGAGGGESDDTSVEKMGGLLIFDRTANGNAKPRGVIQGPKTELWLTEQLQVYPPRGWIIVPQPTDWSVMEPGGTFIGVWSIRDNGDVPPRWKIGGPKTTITKPRGVAINPRHKEIYVADMTLNTVLTFYFPEIF